MVIAGLACQEVGASFAVVLFPLVGALGMVTLRLVFSAIILLIIARPKLRGHSRGDWMTVVGFGVVLATMNMLFYEALARLPLGTTVTIEVLGPLVLSVAVSRRASSWLWAVLAFAGVVLLSQGGADALDPVGVAFAAGAGAAWAGYILLSSRSGRRFAKLDGIALAMAVAAVVSLPFGVGSAGGSIIQPSALLLGLAVAVLSSTIPYAFELIALRRLPEAAFSILMSLAPAIAALAGLVILGQQLTWVEGVAIVLVIAASIGAVRAASVRARQEVAQGVA
ncbi:EamA family transporter [Subtercola endophyticus]|uniref:EamA family transporter n=1 Tax=Subtercola endophyticus TaxID=2895559 RepID=UPI001E398F74|nr:EamA family transporter [Subtercola endophyticus]UFS61281.1 EamA family transporter [Subtercola endophyticus]